MNINNYNDLIKKINAANLARKLTSNELRTIVDMNDKLESLLFTELKCRNWTEVGTKHFGPNAEKYIKLMEQQLNNFLNPPPRSKMSAPKEYPAQNMSKQPVYGPKGQMMSQGQTSAPDDDKLFENLSNNLSLAVELPELAPMCICPEDHGIIRQWTCPKHGSVVSKKANPLTN